MVDDGTRTPVHNPAGPPQTVIPPEQPTQTTGSELPSPQEGTQGTGTLPTAPERPAPVLPTEVEEVATTPSPVTEGTPTFAEPRDLAAHLLERAAHPEAYPDAGVLRFRNSAESQQSLTQFVAAGEASLNASNRPRASTPLDYKLLEAILAVLEAGLDLELWAMTTGDHMTGSAHYSGLAVDLKRDLAVYAFFFEQRVELCIGSLITMPRSSWPEGTHNLYNGQYGNADASGHTQHVHVSVMERCP